jgi:hypothetical protein
MSRLPVALLLGTLAPALPGQEARDADRSDTPNAILARHVAFLGGPSARDAAGDLELRGTITRPAGSMRYRALLRRRPFAFREEFEAPGGRSIWITDGRYAWSVRDERERGAPLRGSEAVSLIEHALFEGMLYLDPEHRGAATVGHPWSVPAMADAPGEPERPRAVDVIVIRNGAGTVWSCLFDGGRPPGRVPGRRRARRRRRRMRRGRAW